MQSSGFSEGLNLLSKVQRLHLGNGFKEQVDKSAVLTIASAYHL